MKKKLDRYIFKLAQWLLDHQPVCSDYRGRGHHTTHIQIDAITTMDTDSECTTCEGYGRYPLSWFTWYIISLLPRTKAL